MLGKFTFLHPLRNAVEWLAGTSCWTTIRFRDCCGWQPQTLVAAALVWAWSPEAGLLDRFQAARKIIATAFEGQQELAGSYQAFAKMLIRWTNRILPILVAVFRRRMQQELKEVFIVAGRIVFGVDGSHQKGQVPQAWLTVLWHVGSRLPWAWRQGRADASERDHRRQMIPELPEHAFVTADAGFVGYEY